MLAAPNSRAWSWWSERSKGGGILGALGSHLIDSLLWWFGDVEEVGAQLNTFVKRRLLPDGSAWREVTADDDVALLLRFASGARCTVDLSSVTRPGGNRLEAYGGAGALVLDEDTRVLAARGAEALEEQEIPERLVRRVEADDRLAPFVELADRVLARMRREDHGDFPDFRQGLRVQAVMDAAHRSVAERRFVAVREVNGTG
jgi:predicted dehydrogenase